MRQRYDELETRKALLLQAFALVTEANDDAGTISWLVNSTARAIRETTAEMDRLLEGE